MKKYYSYLIVCFICCWLFSCKKEQEVKIIEETPVSVQEEEPAPEPVAPEPAKPKKASFNSIYDFKS